MSIINGGLNTIVLAAKTTAGRISSLKIDLGNSTAAAALGFESRNSKTSRFGSSPAQLTGNKTQPFQLTNGSTLTVQADDQPPQTIAFATGSFANIGAATTAEVVNAIVAVALSFTSRAGTGNDFLIRGGDGVKAGQILVDGQMTLNETDLKYSEQPLFKNTALATLWNVAVVPELTTPGANELSVIYLDVWHREVDSNEDSELVDNRIGIETALRLRREWTVRVAKLSDFPAVLAAKPAGHSFYRLAQLSRTTNKATIDEPMITDERETDLALSREVAYRGPDGTVLVSTSSLRNTLTETRDNIRDFIQFLATKFIQPSSAYVAGEVAGTDALSSVASLADHGIALLNARSLSTRGAVDFFGQLAEAEKRFVSVWKDAVLPINKGSGKIYEAAYKEMIKDIEIFLTGPAPVGFLTVVDAVQRRNLKEAVRSQEMINSEFGSEISRPTGFLTVVCLGSITPTIVKNQSFDLRYRLTGTVKPPDDIEVEVFVDAGWQATVKKADGTLPFALQFGENDSKEFVISVLPPNVDAAQAQFSMRINAKHNRNGLATMTAPKTLKVGDPPPLSEQDFAFRVATANVSRIGNDFQVPISLSSSAADINFQLRNNTNSAVTLNLELQPATSPPWNIVKGPFPLNGNVVNANSNSTDFLIHFVPPNVAGVKLNFTLVAKNAANASKLAEIQISLLTVT
jgi:hypothetical protein